MNTEIVLIADPKVVQIPIQENQEPLVDLKDQNSILYGPSPEIENNPCYTKMRREVFLRLQKAQSLLPSGLKICLYEALRTLELQKFLFEDRQSRLRSLHSDWTEEALYLETIKMVSPLKTWNGMPNVPPHSTGAAVDVYLVDSWGEPLEMGIHPKDWMSDLEGNLSKTNSSFISEKERANRQILFEVMRAVGFVNYPTEYWHWSFGDRYWAFMEGQSSAFYGPV